MRQPDSRIAEVGVEEARMQQFANLVQSELPVGVWDPAIQLEADDPVRHAIGAFYTNGRSTGLLLDTNLAEFDPESVEPDAHTVAFMPRRSRAGKNSAHGVFFGDLILSSGATLSLAVKPHDVEGNEKSALTDLLCTQIVERLGFYTLAPAGLLLNGDPEHDTAYSLTVLDEGLSTFDSVDWSSFAMNMSSHPGMREQWRAAANQTAVLHDSGQACHGDLAGRNIATSGDGGAFLIDWEKARFSGAPPRDAEVRYQYSYADLSVLLESMARSPEDPFKPGIGLLHENVGDWWGSFKEVFFEDYLITRRVLAEQGNHNKQRHLDITEELEVLEATLRADCQMFREIHEDQQAAWRFAGHA